MDGSEVVKRRLSAFNPLSQVQLPNTNTNARSVGHRSLRSVEGEDDIVSRTSVMNDDEEKGETESEEEDGETSVATSTASLNMFPIVEMLESRLSNMELKNQVDCFFVCSFPKL